MGRHRGRPSSLGQRNRVFRLFHDSFKAPIITQRIPPRMQSQLAVGNRAIKRQQFFKLFDRKMLLSNPGIGDREISQDSDPVIASLKTGTSSAACWPSFTASSLRQSAASAMPRTDKASAESGCLRRTSFLTVGTAA